MKNFIESISDFIGALKFWKWQKVKCADISPELRKGFERYGEDLLVNALVSDPAWHAKNADTTKNRDGSYDFRGLIILHEKELLDWLTEKRDLTIRREERQETVEVAILIFVMLEVMHDYSWCNLLLCLVLILGFDHVAKYLKAKRW